jgi:hypothetical protein
MLVGCIIDCILKNGFFFEINLQIQFLNFQKYKKHRSSRARQASRRLMAPLLREAMHATQILSSNNAKRRPVDRSKGIFAEVVL